MGGMGGKVGSVCGDLDRAIEVGSEDPHSTLPQARDCVRGRVAVFVVGADADHSYSRMQRVEQRLGRRRAAAVMRDLQHVELRSQVLRQALRK
jgi:hypothetical protein